MPSPTTLSHVGHTQAVGFNTFAAHVVDAQASVGLGLPGFSVTGDPDASVREARDRVRAASKNSGFTFP